MVRSLRAWVAALALGFVGAGACNGPNHIFPTDGVSGASGEGGEADAAGVGAGAVSAGGSSAGSAGAAAGSGAGDQCAALSTDLASDTNNCGKCGHDCAALLHLGSTADVSCSSGKCVVPPTACAEGFAHCTTSPDDGCETDLRLPDHCGGCDTPCTAEAPLCTTNGCAASCPTATPTVCGQSCADLVSDPKHCGDCDKTCPGPVNGQATCSAKVCGVACLDGYTLCGAACLDTTTDPKNCGACAHDCGALPNVSAGATVQCVASKCVIPAAACSAGFAHCSATPDDGCEVDITSPNNCGKCGTKCPAGNPICTPGGCKNSCPASTPTLCGNTCSDLTSDAQHCSDCAKACPTTQICKDSKCGCDAGQHLCGSACKASDDITACGASCTKCTVPTGGSNTCDGTKCGTPSCPNGQQLCGNACIDNNKACNGSCLNNKFLCPDQICRDDTLLASCGQTCQPCAAKTNATATSCDGTSCGYTCNASFIECTNKNCGRIAWDFDTGTTQGWGTTLDSATESVDLSSAKSFNGSSSLAGRAVNGDFYHVFIESSLCSGQSTSVLGRRFTAEVLMDMTPTPGDGASGFPTPYLCLSWKDSSGTYTADNGCKIPDKSGWYKFVSNTLVTIPNLTAVRLEVMLSGGGWTGKMYVDDIQLVLE